MQKRLMPYILTALSLLLGLSARATHLVGGEITYECLGNDQYEVTMVIYRDCFNNGAELDDPAVVTVYDQNNSIVINRGVPLINKTSIAVQGPNDCTAPPSNLCLEKGVYKTIFTLPPIVGGYVISHQRCCRNPTITNINNGNTIWGSTYTTSIPSMDNCNSTPTFTKPPPVVLCLNEALSVDMSASNPDGDSLYYELCTVLHGGAKTPNSAIAPDPALPPPYSTVPFINGYSSTYPIASSPAFSIDPATGIMQGTPNQIGQYVFAICVSEYSNNQLLSTTRRDFQFNVAACQSVVSSVEEQQLTPANICSGTTIQFTNLSENASDFLWDFGDTTTLGDTSVQQNPTYTYPDTGTYYVTLIAEPYKDCADTSVTVFEVFESSEVEFTHEGEYCAETNQVDFHATGNYSDDANFQWDFGGDTESGDPSAESPQDVKYTAPGRYYVRVEVTDFKCSASHGDTVIITENPVIAEEVPALSECAPYTVQFQDQSFAEGPVQHFWFFGDGSISNEPSPAHTYLKPGTYTVQHAIKTLEGCLDSGYSRYENVISIYPTPNADFEVYPREQSIYHPEFTFINKSIGEGSGTTTLPGDLSIQNLNHEKSFSLEDTGTYVVSHISRNAYGCADTLFDTIRVTTPFNLFVPNSFTPDGDGVNDEFFFTVTDVRAVTLQIYNRWGQVVFSSNDLNARWNGRMNNTGNELPTGMYSYVLIADVKKGGFEHKKKGIIHLLR